MIRLVIVEDHAAMAEGLARLLEQEGMEIVGLAGSAAAAEPLIVEQRPDVVLCDIMLHGRDEGLDLVARHHKQVRFIILSAYDYPAHHARAMEAGASGYLPKVIDTEDLVLAIKAVVAGETRFDPHVLESARLAPRPPTRRERELLVALVDGQTNEEIAGALGISVKTVEGMLRRLFGRYRVDNRTELVRLVNSQGWLTSGD